MNTNSAFTGHFQKNPFHYRKFGLRELRIVRGGELLSQLIQPTIVEFMLQQ